MRRFQRHRDHTNRGWNLCRRCRSADYSDVEIRWVWGYFLRRQKRVCIKKIKGGDRQRELKSTHHQGGSHLHGGTGKGLRPEDDNVQGDLAQSCARSRLCVEINKSGTWHTDPNPLCRTVACPARSEPRTLFIIRKQVVAATHANSCTTQIFLNYLRNLQTHITRSVGTGACSK